MKQQLVRLAEVWDRFWFIEGPAHCLACLRIMFGTYLLWRWLWWLPDIPLRLSNEGMFIPFRSYPENIGALEPILLFASQPGSPAVAWIVYALTIGCLVMMTIGLFTRTAIVGFLALLIYEFFVYIHMSSFSYDRITFLLTFILILGPGGRAISLDAWLAKKRGRPFPEIHRLWTQRLICMLVAAMYFGTGLYKLTQPDWSRGEVVGTAMLGEWSTWLGHWVYSLHLPWGFWDLAVIIVILFELSAGFLLFRDRYKVPYMIFGASFHLANGVLLDIWQFLMVPPMYVCFFDPVAVRDTLRKYTRFAD